MSLPGDQTLRTDIFQNLILILVYTSVNPTFFQSQTAEQDNQLEKSSQ